MKDGEIKIRGIFCNQMIKVVVKLEILADSVVSSQSKLASDKV